jgi:hypothetical protein
MAELYLSDDLAVAMDSAAASMKARSDRLFAQATEAERRGDARGAKWLESRAVDWASYSNYLIKRQCPVNTIDSELSLSYQSLISRCVKEGRFIDLSGSLRARGV